MPHKDRAGDQAGGQVARTEIVPPEKRAGDQVARTKNVPPEKRAGDQVTRTKIVQPRLRPAADRAGRWRRRPRVAALAAMAKNALAGFVPRKKRIENECTYGGVKEDETPAVAGGNGEKTIIIQETNTWLKSKKKRIDKIYE